MIYPKAYSIYLRRTVAHEGAKEAPGYWGVGFRDLGFRV